MKTLIAKEFVSHAVIAVAAFLFALAFVSGAGALLASGNEFLLLTLTLCGAVLSGINGFGRRTASVDSQQRGSRRGPQSGVALTS
jgi:hypothetical protein